MTKNTFLFLLLLLLAAACSEPEDLTVELEAARPCTCEEVPPDPLDSLPSYHAVRGALLATRFQSFEELKQVIKIEHYRQGQASPPSSPSNNLVRVSHCSNGLEVVSILYQGISEGDLRKAKGGGLLAKAGMGLRAPFAVSNRKDLQRVSLLARRRPALYGEGDVAFFDLAETMVENINTEDLAFASPKDTSEKGYINSFNHLTAQAFLTSFFSEEIADFVADVHERLHMPELITGSFTQEQLEDVNNNPVDNYVDIVNNEWGQELGKRLRKKHGIDRNTVWTPELLADYLNDIQSYYAWAFQIGFRAYRPQDEVVERFSAKINSVMLETPD